MSRSDPPVHVVAVLTAKRGRGPRVIEFDIVALGDPAKGNIPT